MTREVLATDIWFLADYNVGEEIDFIEREASNVFSLSEETIVARLNKVLAILKS